MHLEKILNFRDVGVTVNTSTGRPLLRPGLFFRSGLPDEASPVDRARLIEEYEIKTIVDLRTGSERVHRALKGARNISSSAAVEPTEPAPIHALRVPGVGYRYINLNGYPYSTALIKQLSYWNVAKLAVLYTFGWRDEAIFILGHNVMARRGLIGLAEDTLTYSTAEVKEVFDVLSNEDNYPLLVHCTQGKDRTGLVVLLVLLLLEAPVQAICDDYMMSEKELVSEREIRLAEIKSIGLPDDFAHCAEDWVQAMAQWLDARHGGMQQYLQSCGVSREQQERVRVILGASRSNANDT